MLPVTGSEPDRIKLAAQTQRAGVGAKGGVRVRKEAVVGFVGGAVVVVVYSVPCAECKAASCYRRQGKSKFQGKGEEKQRRDGN